MNEFEDELLRRLDAFEARLLRIEMRLGIVRNLPPPPPPRFETGPPPTLEADHPPLLKQGWVPQREPGAEAAAAADAEYQLGGRLLPWAGALVTLLAIGYGANLAFQHGFITPWMIFWGGVTLCAAFIVVGQLKRDEREEFGQLLTGIGSCGLYITFAAGHLAQHLYEGEALVGLFVGLSLANLAYSGWRASHAFLLIGVLGGFAGALMPLQDGKVVLHLGLHALILIPSVLIVVRQNWFEEAAILFVLAFAALLPAQTHPRHEWLRALSLEGTALLSAFAYARTFVPKSDPAALLMRLLMLGTAAMALLARGGNEGVAHVVAFGILTAAMSRTLGDRPSVPHVLATGVAIPFLIAPWGLDGSLRPTVFAVLAAGLAVASRFRWDRGASALSGVVFLLGTLAFLILGWSRPIPWTTEVSNLGVLLIAGVLSTAHLIRAWKEPEGCVLAGSLVLGPVLIRLVTLAMSREFGAVDEATGALWGMALAATVLGVLAMIARWKNPAYLGAALLGFALLIYGTDLPARTAHLGWELSLVAAFAAASMAAAAGIGWIHQGARTTLIGVSGATLALLLWRFVFVALSKSALAFEPDFASVLGATLASGCCTAVGRRKGWKALAVPMWLLWLLAGMVAVGGSPLPSRLDEGLAMVALLVSGTWGAVTFDPAGEREVRTAARFCAALALGLPFTRLGVLFLSWDRIGMPEVPAITAAWTAYAAILLALGFAKRTREVRYVGLLAIGSAAVKLVLMDLASSRDLVRFLVTLGLGVAMIGGGYLYIRLQDRLEEATVAPVDA